MERTTPASMTNPPQPSLLPLTDASNGSAKRKLADGDADADSGDTPAKRLRSEQAPAGHGDADTATAHALERSVGGGQSAPRLLAISALVKPPKKAVSPAMIEERDGIIETCIVRNDGAQRSTILLTGLKNIFQAQLPKMPREYIGKLVYDKSHVSLCLVKKRPSLQVLGGIAYKPFLERRFAEIVFCAVTNTEQVKGYGAHIMNHLKDHVRTVKGPNGGEIRHFLTYADNYAVGYFRKQGFTTEISLPRSIWQGYIKDYEGGTLMQCTLVPKVSYLNLYPMLQQQKIAIYQRIYQRSRSNLIYPGLKQLKQGGRLNPMDIPGIRESGWTPELSAEHAKTTKPPRYMLFMQVVEELRNHESAWPFLEPVDRAQVKDYYDVIAHPMDLKTLETNVEGDKYHELDAFRKDVQLIFDNCREYNLQQSSYYKCANKLEKFFHERWRTLVLERRMSERSGSGVHSLSGGGTREVQT
ncbi:histone acetyltransferase [Sorochytrium milnesiophthora]